MTSQSRQGGSDQPILGGWQCRTERVEEGKALVWMDDGRASLHGARVNVTISLDLTIDHGTGAFLNPLLQAVFDGFAAGAYDMPKRALAEFKLLKAPDHA